MDNKMEHDFGEENHSHGFNTMFVNSYSNITENFNDDQEVINEETPNYFFINPVENGIVNPENAEEEGYRDVPIEKCIIGCNLQGSPNRRIIVPELDDESYVREYTKLGNTGAIFYCIKCHNVRARIVGKLKERFFRAPIFHVETCFPILKVEAEERLRINNEKLLQSSNEIRKRSSKSKRHSVKERVETSIETAVAENSATEEPLNKILKELGRLDELAKKREELAKESERLAKRRRKSVRSNDETLLPIVEPIIHKVSIPYKFNHPSSSWLENVCKKLEITYNFSAYCFWAEIQIMQIKETSKPQNVHYFKSGKSSGFRALSYLLSGSENKKVKNVVCKYFFDNFKSLGVFSGNDFSLLSHDSEIIKKFIFAEQFTPELWEITAKWLKCRIGIFENGIFVKYGNWSNSDNNEIITLLFKKENETYCIVKSLADQ